MIKQEHPELPRPMLSDRCGTMHTMDEIRHLHADGQIVAELHVTDHDFPWLNAVVVHKDGFDSVAPLFDDEIRLLDRMSDEETPEWTAAYERIRALTPLTYPDGRDVPEYLLHIDGDEAWWRWSDEPFHKMPLPSSRRVGGSDLDGSTPRRNRPPSTPGRSSRPGSATLPGARCIAAARGHGSHAHTRTDRRDRRVARTSQRIRAVFEQVDERFRGVAGDEYVAVHYEDGRWLEGPAYSRAWRSLLFSDIPNDRVLRLDETTGAIGVWRQPAGYANGRTIDRQGRVISCEQGTRAVTRTEFDGTVTVLADRWDGRRLNSPNDVVVRADGTVWFTDPSYGIDSDYEGSRAPSETDGCHVYRIDPDGTVVRVADDFERPNGLAFSADERQLYVVDTRRKHIRRFDVDAKNQPSGGDLLAECDAGSFDGIRVDHQGRIWAAAHDGLHCFDPADGALLGKLRLPEICSNLTFGGPKGNIIYVTASNTLFSIMTNCTGATYPTG